MPDHVLIASLMSGASFAILLGFKTWLHEREGNTECPRATPAFSWWTYYVAHRRAFKREYNAFLDHYRAYRGLDEWRNAMRLTALIHARKVRERDGRCTCGHGVAYHMTEPKDDKYGIIFTEDLCHHESRTMVPGMVLLCGCHGYKCQWWPFVSKKYKPFSPARL